MIEKWFVLCTKPRNELKVLNRLISLGIDAYTPSRIELRQWSDRKKKSVGTSVAFHGIGSLR